MPEGRAYRTRLQLLMTAAEDAYTREWDTCKNQEDPTHRTMKTAFVGGYLIGQSELLTELSKLPVRQWARHVTTRNAELHKEMRERDIE